MSDEERRGLYGTFISHVHMPEANRMLYMQDFLVYRGIPAGVYAVYARFGSYALVADGHGMHPPEGTYGSGPLLVRAEALDPLLCEARYGVWNWTGL